MKDGGESSESSLMGASGEYGPAIHTSLIDGAKRDETYSSLSSYSQWQVSYKPKLENSSSEAVTEDSAELHGE